MQKRRIDVHKKMLAVVVTDVAGEGEYQFERRYYAAESPKPVVIASDDPLSVAGARALRAKLATSRSATWNKTGRQLIGRGSVMPGRTERRGEPVKRASAARQ